MTTTTFRSPAAREVGLAASQAAETRQLEDAADLLLRAMTQAGLDAPTWSSAGPLVSAAAQQLRLALGTADGGSTLSAPAVAREADFASAMRPLLSTWRLEDPAAARQFVRLAQEAALALG